MTNCGRRRSIGDMSPGSRTGRPGVIVARDRRAVVAMSDRAFRAIRSWRTCQVCLMVLFPWIRLVVFSGGRRRNPVVYPTVPSSRDRRSFGIAIVDDPTPLAPFGIKRAFIVDVAELVFTHFGTLAPCKEAGTEGLSVPPCEELGNESLSWVSCSVR